MSIFDVRNQPRAHKTLQRALACGRLPHAYLFHGPEGVGREMLALRLARVLLCERAKEVSAAPHSELADFKGPWRDACGACRDCVLAGAGTHPDLHLIYRELRKHHPDSTVRQRVSLELNVDVIRHFLLDRVGAKPFRGRCKVFIVRDADLLSPEAQNALLKTLEEPPLTTFLVLISTGLAELLPTTRSRCQQVPFGPLPMEFVVARLAEQATGVSAEQTRSYALLAEGSLGTALRLAEDGIAEYQRSVAAALQEMGERPATKISKQWADEAKALGEAFRKRDSGITDTEAQRRGLKLLFSVVAASLNARLHAQTAPIAGSDPTAPRPSPSPTVLARAIQAVAEAEHHIDLNASVQLAIDALVVRLARLLVPT